MTNNTRSLSQHKGLREMIQTALDQGWRVERQRRSGHLRWYPPDGGPFVSTSSTPSDVRALKSIRSDLRRIGGLNI